VDLRPGSRVDRYTLVEPIGEGGQGCVWKVIDPERATVRALKVLDAERMPASAARRAKLEVQAVMRSADHPAVVPCFDVVILPDRRVGLVFELVRGQALGEVLDDPRMTPTHRNAVLVRLASALAHVHGQGVVHRDLKPDNVLVTDSFWREPRAEDAVRLVDFGIAAVLTNATGLTSVGSFVGTVPYVPPEVLLQRPASGPARDVFAFGVLGWELVFGGHPSELPHDASVAAFASAYRAALTGAGSFPRRPGEGPLAPVFRACLALDPATRLADGAAVERALWTALGDDVARPSRRTKPHATPRDTEPRTTSQPVIQTVPSEPVPEALSRPAPATAPMTPLPTARSENANLDPHVTLPPLRPVPVPEEASERGLWVLALLLLAALAAVVYIVMWVLPEQTVRPTAPRPPASLAPPPASAPPARPSARPGLSVAPPQPAPPNATAPEVTHCCASDPSGKCKSGRDCQKLGSCENERTPERRWLLRITGVARGRVPSFPEDVAGTHPSAILCLNVVGREEPEVCAPLRDISASKDGDRQNRLPVLTSDLEQERVTFRLLDGTTTLAEGRSSRVEGGYSTSALCDGVVLFVGPKARAAHKISAFLDDE
jgi:serine/threonine protein kinase